MSETTKHYLFVNPQREEDAARAGKELFQFLPIRVSTVVPRNEIWWGTELPDQVEIIGNEVRVVHRLEIVHKLLISENKPPKGDSSTS